MNRKSVILLLAFFALIGCASDSIGEKKSTGVSVKNASDEVIKLIRFWSSTIKSEFHPSGLLSLGKGAVNGFTLVDASFPTDGTLTWIYSGVEHTKPIDTKPYGSPSDLALEVLVVGEQLYTCKRQLGCVCYAPTDPLYDRPPEDRRYPNCPVHGPY